jgi:hypothetical protein
LTETRSQADSFALLDVKTDDLAAELRLAGELAKGGRVMPAWDQRGSTT